MKKVTLAVLAGFMTLAFAGAYAADDMKKADTAKSEKATAKSADKSKGEAVTDDKKKKDDKTK
jgi:hypothetical protein